MALTRDMLKEMNLGEEAIEAIISAHSETVSGLKDDLKAAEDKAAQLEAVQKELDDAKAAAAETDDFKAKYEQEHADFEAFKQAVADEKALAEKRDLYRTMLSQLGIDEGRIDAILKITDFADMMVENGALKDQEALAEKAKTDYEAFIVQTVAQGAEVATPPANDGSKLTREEIFAIKDTGDRQKAIAENHELFGF